MPLFLFPGLCNLFFRFYRSGLVRVRAKLFSMGVRMRVVPWREVWFLLRVMFGVRVEVVIGMVHVFLFLTCFIRALFLTGMVFSRFRVRVVSW